MGLNNPFGWWVAKSPCNLMWKLQQLKSLTVCDSLGPIPPILLGRLARSGLESIFRRMRMFLWAGPPASRNERGDMATIITSEQQFVCGVYVYAKYSNGPRYSLPLFPLLSVLVPLPHTHTNTCILAYVCGKNGQGGKSKSSENLFAVNICICTSICMQKSPTQRN